MLVKTLGSQDVATGKNEKLPIKPYSAGELADLYRCSIKTFNKWIKALDNELGRREGRFYTPRQVKIIVERIGEP